MEEELEARKTYLKKFKKKPEVEFKSSFRTTFDKHLPEAEAEAAKLEGQSLVLRRREIEGHFETRKQEAAQWLAETKSAIAEGRIESAIEAARKYALAGAPEEMDAAIKLLRELDQAQPMLVYAKLSTLSASKLQQIIADERLPADWPQPSEDAAMAEAIRKSAVRLAPLNLGVLQKAPLADQFLEAQNAVELTKLRKFLFLFEAEGLRDERRLTPKNVQSLVDQFGAFRVDDLTPLIDIALAKDSREMGEETAEAYINSVAAGDIRPMSLRQLYDDCRKAAGDSWPVDDERHSLAGRWQSKGVWQLHIDPEHESIAWLRSSPQAKFEQRICKIGRDHVVAYELRTRDQRMPANHPFAKEKLEDRGSYEQLFNGLERLVMLTSFKLDKRGETLKVRREAIAAAQFREAATTGLWNRMSNDKASREWPEEFQRIEPEDQQ